MKSAANSLDRRRLLQLTGAGAQRFIILAGDGAGVFRDCRDWQISRSERVLRGMV